MSTLKTPIMRILLTITLAISLVLGNFTCTSFAELPTISTIYSNQNELKIPLGTTYTIPYNILIYAKTVKGNSFEITPYPDLYWTIDDPNIAYLPYNGTIVASKKGETYLRLNYLGLCTSIKVKVVGDQNDEKSIISIAYSWSGTPYSWGGNSKKGIDCSHFVHQVYTASGFSFSYITATNLSKNPDNPPKGLIRVYDPQPGDIVVFAPGDGVTAGHMGILLDSKTFIGAQTNGVGEASFGKYWGKKREITGYYRTSK